jgi:hypothetical protein
VEPHTVSSLIRFTALVCAIGLDGAAPTRHPGYGRLGASGLSAAAGAIAVWLAVLMTRLAITHLVTVTPR